MLILDSPNPGTMICEPDCLSMIEETLSREKERSEFEKRRVSSLHDELHVANSRAPGLNPGVRVSGTPGDENLWHFGFGSTPRRFVRELVYETEVNKGGL